MTLSSVCLIAQYWADGRILRRSLVVTSLIFLVMLNSGCMILSQFDRIISPPVVDLAILQITPQHHGQYLISGNTNLPDQTRLTVSAVRSLQPKDQQKASSAIYAILDRQMIEVKQQTWTANLHLLQPSPGGVKEVWQRRWSRLEQVPDPHVNFLVTLEPFDQPVHLRQQLDRQALIGRAETTRFTTEGERYFQASQTLVIPPPAGQPVTVALPQIDRPVTLKASPEPNEDQGLHQPSIDMPIAADAFLN